MEQGVYREQENSHLEYPDHTTGLEDKPSAQNIWLLRKKFKYLEGTDK